MQRKLSQSSEIKLHAKIPQLVKIFTKISMKLLHAKVAFPAMIGSSLQSTTLKNNVGYKCKVCRRIRSQISRTPERIVIKVSPKALGAHQVRIGNTLKSTWESEERSWIPDCCHHFNQHVT